MGAANHAPGSLPWYQKCRLSIVINTVLYAGCLLPVAASPPGAHPQAVQDLQVYSNKCSSSSGSGIQWKLVRCSIDALLHPHAAP